MSHVIVNQIRRLPIKNPAKAVLWVIADIADEKGYAFPSQATIALECGITDRTVRNCIHALESCGVLVVNRSDSRHTTYSVTPEKYVQPERDSGTTFRNESKTNRNDVPVHRNIVPINRNDVPVHRNDVPPNHQLTINNPQVTPSVMPAPSDDTAPTTKKPSPAKLLKELGCDDQLTADFIAHRKAKKAAITQTALNLIVSQAAKAGISFSRAVEITIERNWVSFNASWKWQDDQPKETQQTWQEKQNAKWAVLKDMAEGRTPPKTVGGDDNLIEFLGVRHG